MADVFISYSRQTRERADLLLEALQSHGYDTWIDWVEIHAGQLWWNETLAGIHNCNNFVCLMNSSYAASALCQLELAHAIQLNKRIIPIMLEPMDYDKFVSQVDAADTAEFKSTTGHSNPLERAKKNWQVVERVNWLHFPEHQTTEAVEDFLRLLVDTVKIDLEYIRKHTHYGMNAQKWDLRGRKSEFLMRGEELQDAVLWLETNSGKAPAITELQRQYILESQYAAARYASPLRKAIYAATYRLFGMGPHKIFISYRRADSAYACGWIYDQLEQAFGRKNIFLDVDSIDYGSDFSQSIQRTLTECFAVLVVIGPQWLSILNARSQQGTPDFVHIEVEQALKRKHVNVIPLLIGDVPMPQANDLPTSLQDLPLKNGTPIRAGRTFHQDISVLIKELKKLRSQVRMDYYA